MIAATQYTPTIWKAGPEDLQEFAILWSECIEELSNNYGAELLPKSIEDFIGAFNYIVADPSRGIVILAQCGDHSVGALMWGQVSNAAMPTKFGKVAIGFGTYVRKQFRKQGISNEMRSAAVGHLRKYKFDTLLGAVHVDNIPARLTLKEFDLHQLIYTLDLSKPYKEI